MNMRAVETAVGVFVIVGLICTAYLTIRLGKMEWFGNSGYTVHARFQSVSGLRVGAQVEMAGVQIGRVESIRLDPERKVANVSMRIQSDVSLSEDVIASVKTSGMIGDKFVQISPGASEEMLGPGDSIVETESAVNLEDLISKYMFGEI